MAKTPFLAKRRALKTVDEANALNDRGDSQGAWVLLERAVREDPECFEAEFVMGQIANDMNRFEIAAPHLERAVALDAKAAHAYSELGRAYHQLHRRGDAEAAYNKALGIKADPYTMLNLATLFRDTGRFGEATKLYEQAVATGKLDAETDAKVRAML